MEEPFDDAELMVRNLGFETTSEEVVAAFATVGCSLERVTIPRAANGKRHGFAFVKLPAGADSEAVLKRVEGTALPRGGLMSVMHHGFSFEQSNLPPLPPADVAKFQPPTNADKRTSVVLNRQISETRTSSELLELYFDQGDNFDTVNLATALHRIGRLGRCSEASERDARMRKLVDHATWSITNDQRWDSRALANATWGVAKVDIKAPVFFDIAARRALPLAELFNPQELSNTLWAFATIKKPPMDLFIALGSVAMVKIAEFNPQDISNTLWAFAAAGVESKSLFDALAECARPILTRFAPQNLANAAWAFATAGVKAPELFAAISAATRKVIRAFNAQDLANTCWAFAVLGVQDDILFREVADATLAMHDGLSPQNLANTALAFATAGVRHDALFRTLKTASLKQSAFFKPREIANLLFAYATIEEGEELFPAFANFSQRLITNFSAGNLAQLAWAYASFGKKTLALRDGAFLYGEIGDAATALILELSPKDVATMMWSLASLGCVTGDYDQLASLSQANVAVLSPRSISQVVWAAATVQLTCSLDVFGKALLAKLHDATLGDLARLIFGFCSLVAFGDDRMVRAICAAAQLRSGDRSSEVVEVLEALVAARLSKAGLLESLLEVDLGSLKPAELVRTAAALAKLGALERDPNFLESLAAAAEPVLSQLTPDDLATLAWSLAIAGPAAVLAGVAPAECLDAALALIPQRNLGSVMLRDVDLFLRLEAPQLQLEQPLRSTQRAATPSHLSTHIAVLSAILDDVGFEHEAKLLIDEGVELAIAQTSSKKTIEIDTELCFLTDLDEGTQRTGAAKFRERVIAKLGWSTVHLDLAEWKASVSDVDRKALLKRTLASFPSS